MENDGFGSHKFMGRNTCVVSLEEVRMRPDNVGSFGHRHECLIAMYLDISLRTTSVYKSLFKHNSTIVAIARTVHILCASKCLHVRVHTC